MKKTGIFILLTLFLFPLIAAVNLNVEGDNLNHAMIIGISSPAVFDLNVTNYGGADNFEFYNLLGFSMAPKGTVYIGQGETKEIQLMIYPRKDISHRGFYTLQYYIMGSDKSSAEEKIMFDIIDLKDAFEIGADEMNPQSSSINVYIYNTKNLNFDKVDANLSSPFFNIQESFSLEPNQKKEFEISLNKEDFKKLTAGFYTLNGEITVENQKAHVEGTINFVEKKIVTETTQSYGLIVSTKTIKKTNEGNVAATSETVIQKNIISRLFTYFSPDADKVERKGLSVYYTWTEELNPGDSIQITVKTNWLFPLLIILFVIAVVIIVKQLSKTNLVLKKKVSFVKAKGGEFALKISIKVSAKKYVQNVIVIDAIPPLVKLYERFGTEQPARIDEKNKRIEWNIARLDEGESRIFSYIVYSKVGIMGKFALPATTAIYEKEGVMHEAKSNRAFFVAEQRTRDLEEE